MDLKSFAFPVKPMDTGWNFERHPSMLHIHQNEKEKEMKRTAELKKKKSSCFMDKVQSSGFTGAVEQDVN